MGIRASGRSWLSRLGGCSVPWAAGTRAATMAELWPWGAAVEPRAPAVPRLGWAWGMLWERWWCSLAVFLGVYGPGIAGHHGWDLTRRRPQRSWSARGKRGGGRDALAWVCTRDCRVAGLRLGQGHRREQAAAPTSAFGLWPWDGGGEEAEEAPPVRREQRGRGGCIKEKEVPGGFSANSFS
jgi:hypothetical protein